MPESCDCDPAARIDICEFLAQVHWPELEQEKQHLLRTAKDPQYSDFCLAKAARITKLQLFEGHVC